MYRISWEVIFDFQLVEYYSFLYILYSAQKQLNECSHLSVFNISEWIKYRGMEIKN